ncbi:MAG: glucose-1-phosphate thymidylyltransferase [Flavobacteriales bacterium]|nr:MAG: glucose-1-phosphate thymidylyltransferase [Flavobacteriales bacterium]
MKFNLSDNGLHLTFAPLSLTRPIGDIRMGLFTNKERYQMYLPDAEIGFHTEAYLSKKFNSVHCELTVNANIIPNEDIIAAISNLENNQSLFIEDYIIASHGDGKEKLNYTGEKPVILVERWNIFQFNHLVLKQDFIAYTANKTSQKLSSTNTLIGNPSDLFIEEGAFVEGAILNTNEGPIYIGREAEIMEGSLIRGGLALCANASLKLGAKVYGASTIGPNCKIGGEINNVIFQAYSNKGHDGFLGNSIIGEWCNLGADTNTSNLKNNYSNVKTYSYEAKTEVNTDVQFMGLCMGDFSKSGINTMFNTASIVGVSCNVFGSGFPTKYIPSFSWVNSLHMEDFKLDKAISSANNMMIRRDQKLSSMDEEIFAHLSKNKT